MSVIIASAVAGGIIGGAVVLWKLKPDANQAVFEKFDLDDLPIKMRRVDASFGQCTDKKMEIQCPTHTCVGTLSGYFKSKNYSELPIGNRDQKYDKNLHHSNKPHVWIAAPKRLHYPGLDG